MEWGDPWVPPEGSHKASRGLTPQYWTRFWTYRGTGASGVDLDALAGLVERIQEKKPNGTKKSNEGGWQSPGNLLDVGWVRDTPAFTRLAEEIHRQARSFVDAAAVADGVPPPAPYRIKLVRVWANVNHWADYNAPHIHGAAARLQLGLGAL